MRLHRAAILQLWFGAALACGEPGESGESSETGETGDTGGASESTGGTDQCMRTIVLGRYHDDSCTPGAEFGTLELVLSEPCGAWTRPSPMGEKDDSFTNYQCYADRFCFTVHPGSATCDTTTEDADVELLAGACQPDKNTMVKNYTKILSGLEGCPPVPEGYACPDSGVGEGTPGVMACDG